MAKENSPTPADTETPLIPVATPEPTEEELVARRKAILEKLGIIEN